VTWQLESSMRHPIPFSNQRTTTMANHKHGEMDIKVQEKTFNGFISMVTKGSIGIICLLIFIALVNG
jgi:hypothetical protein